VGKENKKSELLTSQTSCWSYSSKQTAQTTTNIDS